MNDAKEEIRARLPIEDVVGQYMELKRAGRSLKGHSPWGVDKHESFMVSPEKGIWHDFSANKGGDIFTFVMAVEGITFREALEKLAAQAGVELERYNGGDLEVSKKKTRAREALELATKYYQICLTKSKQVCEYVFYKRNMNRKTVEKFRIGYSPANGKILKDVLMKRGFTLEELKVAGLLNQYDGDMFRGRMMVPFIDTNGAVIGFTARVIDKGEPKYLNTSDTLLFNKSRFIFGLYQAKEAIRKNGFVVIVEGNMDVISSHQAGVCEAVATSGTAMTEQHLKILSGLTTDIRLAYDGDDAGVRAAERAIKMASELGLDLSIISNYHGAKDPDELIQKNPELWKQAVNERIPAIDWILQKYEEKLDLASGPGRRKYSDAALPLLEKISDPVERAGYEKMVAEKLGVEVEDLRKKGENLEKKIEEGKKKKIYKKAKTVVVTDKLKKLEESLLALKYIGNVEIMLPFDDSVDNERRAELELVFNHEHEIVGIDSLEKEAAELLKSYNDEYRKIRYKELSIKLSEMDEDDLEYMKTLKELTTLQKTQN